MSIWKQHTPTPGGVMPGGLVTKIGVVAVAILLAALLLTYGLTGTDPAAEVAVPDAASFDLQQRAAQAIQAEAARQGAQARTEAAAAERLLAQLQAQQETEAAILGAGIVPLPGQDPGSTLLPDNQPVPFPDGAPRTEAEAALLETLRLEDLERRRRSLRTQPLVLSYRTTTTSPAGAPPAGAAPSDIDDILASIQNPQFGLPLTGGGDPIDSANDFLDLLNTLTQQDLASLTPPPGVALPLDSPPLVDQLPAANDGAAVVGRATDPEGWDRIFEGSFLEAVLVTQLSGDFPGPVLANISVPFYSADRQRVVIPRGARVLGTVQAVSTQDQERLAVAFHRIIWPDGRSISLPFIGLNQTGEGALRDEVNRHYFSMFAAAGAVGILSGLTAIGSNPYGGGREAFQAGASGGLGESAVDILDRFLNRLPDVTIRAGHRLRIWFTTDVLVPPAPIPTGVTP